MVQSICGLISLFTNNTLVLFFLLWYSMVELSDAYFLFPYSQAFSHRQREDHSLLLSLIISYSIYVPYCATHRQQVRGPFSLWPAGTGNPQR